MPFFSSRPHWGQRQKVCVGVCVGKVLRRFVVASSWGVSFHYVKPIKYAIIDISDKPLSGVSQVVPTGDRSKGEINMTTIHLGDCQTGCEQCALNCNCEVCSEQ